MRSKSFAAMGVFLLFPFALISSASAQSHDIALKKLINNVSKMSPQVRSHLSSGAQAFLRAAAAKVSGKTSHSVTSTRKAALRAIGLIPVSNEAAPPIDDAENTSSSAWCGNAIVVGFQDSGPEALSTQGPISLDGVSASSDRGKTFHDTGSLNPGTFSANALFGDPVVTCSSPSHFQYTTILNTTTPDGLDPIIGPSFSFSNDGGKTWSDPHQVVSADGNTEFTDKPWLAVDPRNPHRLYLSYTRFEFLSCTNIEAVTSDDGGTTWSTPIVIDSECGSNLATGSNVVVSPNGYVYIAYEVIPFLLNPGVTNSIYFSRSADHGQTFGNPFKVSDVVPGGDAIHLNGNVTVNEYPQLAVDRSNSLSRGSIYLTWPDGRDRVVPNPGTTVGSYSYPDAFVAKSTDAGESFVVLGPVSPTPSSFQGTGRDQYLPSIAVNKDANIAVCYYDRRNDSADLRVDRFCSLSSDGGQTWQDQQISHANWLASDSSLLDAYDTVTTDFLLKTGSFFGAFTIENGSNAAVFGKKF